jgi:hypothetical protein
MMALTRSEGSALESDGEKCESGSICNPSFPRQQDVANIQSISLMKTIPLIHRNSHLFIELDDGLWLHDTGAPSSFGTRQSLELLGINFPIDKSYMGQDAAFLSEAVGVDCKGLLGADVLSAFDQILDVPGGCLTLSTDELEHSGETLLIEDFMGIPILSVNVAGEPFRMFFDTGAQVSYLQDDLLETFPSAGLLEDFYPGFGKFETDTHTVPFTLGPETHALRCGQLPGLLGMSLMMADVQGILGNAILENRTVGYFPRRNLFSL